MHIVLYVGQAGAQRGMSKKPVPGSFRRCVTAGGVRSTAATTKNAPPVLFLYYNL